MRYLERGAFTLEHKVVSLTLYNGAHLGRLSGFEVELTLNVNLGM